MKKKLIIWDFDGVVADTEKIWLYNRMVTLNEDYGVNWDIQTVYQHLLGISDRSKREVLNQMGIVTSDAFWAKNKKMDWDVMLSKGFEPTDGIVDIFQFKNIKQCIATGTLREKIFAKIKVTGIEKYFSDSNVFTVDQVEKGKPEPDLFLYACAKMGEKPSDAIVVEDSVAGLKAALAAGCTPVAFTKYALPDNKAYFDAIRELGVDGVFDDMADVKKYVQAQM
ncbi:MAG: HAD family hydrolase [Alphaproteobacteria bacterium]|nr:HAD family hydrolase [Alphaproteobacteria bacterium]